MLDRSLTFLSFGRMIHWGGSHGTSSSTSGFWGPVAGSQAKGPVLQAPPPGLVFSRREASCRSTCYGTCMPWRTLTPPDSVELALSRGAGGSKKVVVVGWSVVQLFGVVCQCWLVACMMVESRFCSWVWSSAGVAHHGVANPLDAVPVSTRARLAGLVLAGLRVVCLRSSGGCSCAVVGAWLSWPPHGRLGLR